MTQASAPSNLRREHPRMRAFSYASSLPVTWQRRRSHHSIRRGRKLHATGKLIHCSVLYRTEVLYSSSFTINGSITRQDAQLSQRDLAAGCVSFGKKWQTGHGRQCFTDIIGPT